MTARLIHVGTIETHSRRFMDEREEAEANEEAADRSIGYMEYSSTDENQGMVLLAATVTGENHVVTVKIGGLYEFDDPSEAPSDREEAEIFYNRQTAELFPFLRQAIYAASGQVWPVNPILLDTLSLSEDEGVTRTQVG